MGKTWIFVVQAMIFGGLAAFSLILGPLFLFGIMRKADGTSGTDGGIAVSTMSMPFLLIFVLAMFNLRARRKPLLRLCREGIEVWQIGSSSIDRIPLIPTLVRIAWLILSTQGFRQKVTRIPWKCFQDVSVSGPPMARQLSIAASSSRAGEVAIPAGSGPVVQIVLAAATFATPLDQIAEAIKSTANSSISQRHLPGWYEAGSTAP